MEFIGHVVVHVLALILIGFIVMLFISAIRCFLSDFGLSNPLSLFIDLRRDWREFKKEWEEMDKENG